MGHDISLLILLFPAVDAVFQGSGTLTPSPSVWTFSAYASSSCDAASASFAYSIRHIYADSNCLEVEINAGTAFASTVYWQVSDCHQGAGSLGNFGQWPVGNPTCSGQPDVSETWSHHDVAKFDTLDSTCKLAPPTVQKLSFPIHV